MSPVNDLRKILNDSLDLFEAELVRLGLPELDLAPVPHPLDDPGWLPPAKLFEARRAACASLDMLSALVKPSFQTLYEGPFGANVVGAWTVAAEANVADVLAGDDVDIFKGLSIDVLAERTGTDAGHLGRCLRVLTMEHVFVETSPDVFANNRISLGLKSPGPFHSWSILNGRYFGKIGLSLGQYVASHSPKPAFQLAANTDKTFYEWMFSDPEMLRWFSAGMQGCGSLSLAGVVGDYNWKELGSSHIVDVGGGQGALCYPLLSAYPDLRVTIQELPRMIPSAKVNLLANWPNILPSRVNFQGHDFFKPNPIHGEDVVYLLRWIVHNWSDEKAISILQGISSVMAPNSRILLVEMVSKPGSPSKLPYSSYMRAMESLPNRGPYAPLNLPAPLSANAGMRDTGMMDLMMMALCESLERTEDDFRRILDKAGLELVKIHYTRGQIHITEARPKTLGYCEVREA